MSSSSSTSTSSSSTVLGARPPPHEDVGCPLLSNRYSTERFASLVDSDQQKAARRTVHYSTAVDMTHLSIIG